ncbi:uridine diphosphate glucose pyrophosphatase NUDT14-like [Sitodiplosis mosellana]|uniref:uridine diphosphate glucose pyrophosphatase NUDT14-like n=1 Tax=Sitodiplosis mosellana TaxID=263140 RepID=UPI002444CD25|nr:uridine diphosphate glucose pyrophosphatase NUDT14-like [Sitodiplosis mosellana]
MDKVTDFHYTSLPDDSLYVKPFRMYYVQNGKEKSWDLLKVHDSVAIIILNKTRNTLVLVRQFRPAVYHSILSSDPLHHMASPQVLLEKYPVSQAITNELCAGIVDKSKSLIEIAREEILEECGYNVPIDRIELVMTYRAGVGTDGSTQTLYYCEVTDDDKAAEGGGVDDEIIDVFELTMDECHEMLKQGAINNAPPSCLFGISWFLTNKTK